MAVVDMYSGNVTANFRKKEIQMTRILLSAFIAWLAVVCQPGFAITEERGTAHPGSALYTQSFIDLQVKIPQGTLDIRRAYQRLSKDDPLEYGWVWNPRWANLIEEDGTQASGEPKAIWRGTFKYEPAGTITTDAGQKTRYEYKNKPGRSIYITNTGYKWIDRSGDWIDYDASGKPIRFGDLFGNTYTLTHDGSGNISSVVDASDLVLISFEYDEDKLTKIYDYSGREVNYTWVDGELREAKGVRDGVWKYEYELDYLAKATDPEEKTTEFVHETIAGRMIDACGASNGASSSSAIASSPFDSLGKGVEFASTLLDTSVYFSALAAIEPQEEEDDEEEEEDSPGGFYYPSVPILRECRPVMAPSQVMLVKTIDAEGGVVEYSYEYIGSEYFRTKKTSDGIITTNRYDGDGGESGVLIDGQVVYQFDEGDSKDRETNAAGFYTYLYRDAWDNITRKEYADGSVEVWDYLTKYNLVTSYTNQKGIITRNEYSDDARLTSTTQAYGLPKARTVSYEYNPDGLPTRITYHGDANTETVVEKYEYDNFGNITKYTDAEDNVTEYFDYDVLGNYWRVKDAAQEIWHYEYDLAGNLTKVTSPLNHVTVIEYDKNSRLVKLTPPGKAPREIVYNGRGQPVQIIQHNSVTEQPEITQLVFRMDNQISRVIDPEGKTWVMEYDAQGKMIRSADAEGNEIRYEYNREDNTGGQKPSKVVFPTYQALYTYDVMERLTSVTQVYGEKESVTSYEYDEIGNLISVIDPEGNTTNYTYDAFDRMSSVTNAIGGETHLTYDNRDNLKSLLDPALSLTQFTYDLNDNRLSEIRPMGQVLSTTYDALDRALRSIDALGQVTKYIYDADGRNTDIEYYSDIEQETPDKTTSFTYDAGGLVTGYADENSSGTFAYDDAGRIVSESVNLGILNRTIGYSYYKNGELKTVTKPDGSVYQYQYDAAGRVTDLIFPDNTRIQANSYQWEAPTQITYPGGTQAQLNVDGLLQLTGLTVADGAANPLLQHSYTYDATGNITSQSTNFDELQYDYDDITRLTSATGSESSEAFTYDAVGNRLTSEGIEDAWQYNASHQLTAIGTDSYQYDDNGSMTMRSVTPGVQQHFDYDIRGRLSQVTNQSDNGDGTVTESTVATYQYDPFGRRISKTVDGVISYFLYGQNGLMAEYNASGNAIREYDYWPGSLWGTNPVYLKHESEHYYYHNDHIGTPQALSNSQGQIVWRAEYDAFGLSTIIQKSINNPLRYPGQYHDNETGLHYNYFRFYDPSLGRYIRRDPLGLFGGLNPYTYVMNNPFVFIDPYGLFLCDALGLLGGTSLGLGVSGGLGIAGGIDLGLSSSGISLTGTLGVGGGLAGTVNLGGNGSSFGASGSLGGKYDIGGQGKLKNGIGGSGIHVGGNVTVSGGTGTFGGSGSLSAGTDGASASAGAGYGIGGSVVSGVYIGGNVLECPEKPDDDDDDC